MAADIRVQLNMLLLFDITNFKPSRELHCYKVLFLELSEEQELSSGRHPTAGTRCICSSCLHNRLFLSIRISSKRSSIKSTLASSGNAPRLRYEATRNGRTRQQSHLHESVFAPSSRSLVEPVMSFHQPSASLPPISACTGSGHVLPGLLFAVTVDAMDLKVAQIVTREMRN